MHGSSENRRGCGCGRGPHTAELPPVQLPQHTRPFWILAEAETLGTENQSTANRYTGDPNHTAGFPLRTLPDGGYEDRDPQTHSPPANIISEVSAVSREENGSSGSAEGRGREDGQLSDGPGWTSIRPHTISKLKL